MQTEVISFKPDVDQEEVRNLYAEYSHFDLTKPRHQRMMKESVDVWEKGAKGISPRAAVAFYEDVQADGDTIHLGTISVKCKAFSKISTEMIAGAFVYCINAGECLTTEDDNLLRKMYANTWGTVFVDLTRSWFEDVLKKRMQDLALEKQKNLFLSPSYGPGFYGMAVSEAFQISKLLDTTKTGVQIKENGRITPEKSCSGIYLVLDHEEAFPEPACVECLGISTSCYLCRLNHSSSSESLKSQTKPAIQSAAR